jgi:hypothetical protein
MMCVKSLLVAARPTARKEQRAATTVASGAGCQRCPGLRIGSEWQVQVSELTSRSGCRVRPRRPPHAQRTPPEPDAGLLLRGSYQHHLVTRWRAEYAVPPAQSPAREPDVTQIKSVHDECTIFLQAPLSLALSHLTTAARRHATRGAPGGVVCGDRGGSGGTTDAQGAECSPEPLARASEGQRALIAGHTHSTRHSFQWPHTHGARVLAIHVQTCTTNHLAEPCPANQRPFRPSRTEPTHKRARTRNGSRL